jgi:hypothetical protein
MQQLFRFTNGYRFILTCVDTNGLFCAEVPLKSQTKTCVDVFSKRGYAIPLKDKRGSSVNAALEEIFTKAKPFKLTQESSFSIAKCKKLFASTVKPV